MSKPTVAILGASSDRSKFGNKSVRAHLAQGYDVYPINPKGGEIEGLTVYSSLAELPVEELDRISVYIPPAVGIDLLDQIAAAGAREVFFNPGSESNALLAAAKEKGIQAIQACSIINVGMQPEEMEP